ncbi:hypothetical protein HYPBUDRAFT_152088 [Hyphopichia burtonii NRRL Y-1933]|uniref:Small ribosomal subunit protein mS38 n=1 Tax=Hyphopichia burtonii NRRL Y-1933 TaxID=984485 RepID=A0A1E4RNA1_9ASCO|nr:hypothetical protein HYPBUDRAFT_152088 [Hyphopichia burtonii NRRL Y-1933]ODV68758.1 hypothetical protein HYPBUDRAFT_152088 [Hyphopichia burtonii NRRL Y-1933]
MFRSVFSRGAAAFGSRMYASIARPVLSKPTFFNLNQSPVSKSFINQIQFPQSSIASNLNAWETPGLEDTDMSLENDNTMYMDSVLRKRRLKMKKHKLRKRRRAQRSLKKRLGKI